MSTITITLADDLFDRLNEAATDRGVSAQELLESSIPPLLELIQHAGRHDRRVAGPGRPELDEAVEYVLAKNAELHRRLAR